MKRPALKIIFLLIALLTLGLSSQPVIQFVDVAKSAGITTTTYTGGVDKNHILESTGNGVLVFDYNGDGYPDIYFVSGYRFPQRGQIEPHSNVLYRNNGNGTFTDVTKQAGVGAAVYGQGGCIGDFDNDGLPDIYVTNFGPNILYRNNGDGTFTDVTAKAGVGDPRWSIGCTFFDADHDGHEDLFVANYIDTTWDQVHNAKRTRMWKGKVPVLDGPKGLPGSRNTFYHNNGDGTFTDATEKAGFLPGANYYSMGVMSFDYNNDGNIDVYVANDSTPNCLYRNKGNGTFEEVGTVTGCAYNADGQEQGSMGVGFGDYDNDGWFDIIVTNFANDYYTLYKNIKGQFFQDESFAAGIAVPTFVPLGWGTFFFDVDRDTHEDLFFANGQIYPQVEQDKSLHETYRQKNQLFLNEGNGKFREITDQAGSGFQTPRSGRGAAYADFDNRGELDVVVSNEDQPPTLLKNQSNNSNHWIGFQLIDTRGDRLALGARVTVVAHGVTQQRQVASGGSYGSQSDFRLFFGLGQSTAVERLTIQWPDGSKEAYSSVLADRYYIIRRGTKPVPAQYKARP